MPDKENRPIDKEQGEIVIYQTDGGDTRIDVRFVDETVWLSQAQLVELYQSSKANISEHIKHIFEEGELDENSVVRKFRTTASDGKNYNVKINELLAFCDTPKSRSEIQEFLNIKSRDYLRKNVLNPMIEDAVIDRKEK